MKVLVIAQYFPPDMGGGATRAYNMAKGLSLAGCDVTVVTAFPHYPDGDIPTKYRKKILSIEHEGKIRIVRTYVPPISSKGFAKRLLLFASFTVSSLFGLPVVHKSEVVLASNPNIIAMIPSLMYKLLNNCSIVQNVDDLWPEALYDLGMSDKSPIAKLGEFIAKMTYGFASAITPISPAYITVLKEKYAVSSSKVCVVLAGADLSMFNLGSSIRSETGKFRVLYIGAFSPAYDFDQLFKAAEFLHNYEDVEFVIQGGGELAYLLRAKSESAKLVNLKVIEKIVSRQQVAIELQKADVLVLPLNGIGSIEMGISSKLYEYQAAGKPILCCSSGQPGRYVSKSASGIVIKPGDFKALAEAVLKLKNRPELARVLGENGRKFVQREASINSVGLKMKTVFQNAKAQ